VAYCEISLHHGSWRLLATAPCRFPDVMAALADKSLALFNIAGRSLSLAPRLCPAPARARKTVRTPGRRWTGAVSDEGEGLLYRRSL
jgi:hypothetical protein